MSTARSTRTGLVHEHCSERASLGEGMQRERRAGYRWRHTKVYVGDSHALPVGEGMVIDGRCCAGSHGWCCDGVAPDLPGTQPAPLREMKSYLAVKATPDRWISAPGLLARARWRASVMKTKQTRTRRDCDASAHVDLIEVNSVPGALQLQRSLCPSEAEARGQTDAFHSPMWQHITGI